MSLRTLMTTFAGRPVQRLDPNKLPAHPEGVAWRLGFGDEDEYRFYSSALPDNDDALPLGELLLLPLQRWDKAASLEALVISCWGDPEEFYDAESDEIAAALVQIAPRLTGLEALFVGDIPRFMSDLAYILQSDLGGVVRAFPRLKVFGARGGSGLQLSDLRHDRLEELILETSGMSGECVRDVAAAELPALRRLDLWLGTDNYGLTATVDDLGPILSGKLFPSLTHLGIKNVDIADAIAIALATAPVVERLEVLDLSLGTMTDEGALALLSNPALGRLRQLDVSENFLSDEMNARLRAAFPNTIVTTGTQKAPYDDWRYISHGE